MFKDFRASRAVDKIAHVLEPTIVYTILSSIIIAS